MKPFNKTKRYKRWSECKDIKQRDYGLSKICFVYFREIIDKFKIERQKEIKKKFHQKMYQKNKSRYLKNCSIWAKKARNSDRHSNLAWILEKSNPDIINGTVCVPIYINPKSGYVQCGLYGKTYYVHQLIMMKYLNKFLSKDLEINHIDLNKQNNKIDNLELVTHKQNIEHAVRNNAMRKPTYTFEEAKERAKNKRRLKYLSGNCKRNKQSKEYSKKYYEKNKENISRKAKEKYIRTKKV